MFDIPVRGRTFNDHDLLQSEHFAVVNEAFAREYLQGRVAVGQKIRLANEHEWLTVVGVVGNEARPTVYEEMKWIEQPVYRPMAQHPTDYFAIALHTATGQSGIGYAIEQALASVDGRAAVDRMESMQSRLAPYLKYPRFRAVVLGAFSCLAVLLAAVGLYGVLAQFVVQRTPEIGVRMALGAQASDIVGWIARMGGISVASGLAFGFCATLALSRYLTSILYGVTTMDPLTFLVVCCLMIAVTLVAGMLPARRALRVDPLIALHSE